MQVQIDGLAFYALCQESISGSTDVGSLTWDTTITLLKTVDNEGLYNALDANGTQVLRSSGNAAVRLLTSSCHGNGSRLRMCLGYMLTLVRQNIDTTLVDKALDVLTLLTRIDYDLMVSELPVIWPVLAHVRIPRHIVYACMQSHTWVFI